MINKTLNIVLVALMTVLGVSTAQAAAFFLYEHGARATGRGGAVIATVSDGSAIFHNVAGIAGTKGYSVLLGANYISPTQAYVDPNGNRLKTDQGASVTPNVYLTARLSDKVVVGLGMNTPFGSTISWPAGTAASAVVKEQSLRTFFITPSLGLNLASVGVRIGAGIDFVPADVRLQREIPFGPDVRASADLGGSAFGVGARVGVQINPPALKGLHLGLAVRSPVSLEFKGKGDFDAPTGFRSSLPPDSDVFVPITLPMSLNAGVGYQIADLQLEVGVTWTDWRSYKAVVIGVVGAENNIVSPKDYQPTTAIRLGAEYALKGIGLDVRAGVVFDPTPIPADTLDVALPDIDRTSINAGLTYHVGETFWVDVGFLYVLPGENKPASEPLAPPLKGTYEVSALVASLSLGVSFGGEEKAAATTTPMAAHQTEPATAPAHGPATVAEPTPAAEQITSSSASIEDAMQAADPAGPAHAG